MEPVSGVVLPPDASLISVVVSGPSLGFTAVRATTSSLVMYRGVASREGSEFVAMVHEEVVRLDELSDRLRSGEWRILELAGPVSDSSGDLYAAALLEPVDGDLVVEVWDVSRRRLLAEFPATELVKLSLGDGRLLVACEGSVVVIPLSGGPPLRVRVPGRVLDMAGDWVLYRAWDGYHVGEISGVRLARDHKLPGPAARVALYEPMGYVLAWSGNRVYVVDVWENRFAGVIDVPGKVQLVAPPFIVYGEKIGVLYLARIWLDHEALLTHDVFIVDNEAKAIYRLCNSREIKFRTILRRIPKRIYPPYPVEFHPSAVGVVVAYWAFDCAYHICCSDERTRQTLMKLLRYPEVRRAFDTLNTKVTIKAASNPKYPAFKIDRKPYEVVFRFEDWSDFDYNDVIVGVPLLPIGSMVLRQVMYGKDWVLLELIPPARGSLFRIIVNGRRASFYILSSDRTLDGPYWWYWVSEARRLLILVKGLKEKCGTIRVDFKSARGIEYSKAVRYALPRVRIERVSYRILLYDANRDELLTRVEARLLVRNTIARMVSVAVFDGNGNLVAYRVYREQYPSGEYTVSEEFRLRPPERGPLKVVLLVEYDGDLVIASDRKFVLKAEPERAERLVPYVRPGRLVARVLDYGLNWVKLRVESEEPGALHIEDARGRPIPFYVLEGSSLLGPYGKNRPLKLGTVPVTIVLRGLEPGESYRFRLVRRNGILTVFEVECALPKADLRVELLGGSLEGRSLTLAFSVRGSVVNSKFKELDVILREGNRVLWRERVALTGEDRFSLPLNAAVKVSGNEGSLTLEVVAHYDHDTVLPDGGEFRTVRAPARRVLEVTYGRPHVEIVDYGLNWLLLRVIPWRPGSLIVRVNGRPATYYVKRGRAFEKHSASRPYRAEGSSAVEILLCGLEKRGTIDVTNESGGFSSTTTVSYRLPRDVEVSVRVVRGRYFVDKGELTLTARVSVRSVDTVVRRIVLRVLDDSGSTLGEVARDVEIGPGTHELTLPVKVHVHRECGRLRLQVLAEFDHGTVVRDPREGPVPRPARSAIDVPYSAPRLRVVDRGINWLLLELTTREGGELVVYVNGRKAWYFLAESRRGDWSGPYDPASVSRNSTVFVLVPGVPPKGEVSVVLAGWLERVCSVEYELPSVTGRISVRNVSVSEGKVTAEAYLWLEVRGTEVRGVDVTVEGAKSWSVNASEGSRHLDLSDVKLGEGVHLIRLLLESTPKSRTGTIRAILRVHYEGDSVFDPERRTFVEKPLVLILNVPYVLPQPSQRPRQRKAQAPRAQATGKPVSKPTAVRKKPPSPRRLSIPRITPSPARTYTREGTKKRPLARRALLPPRPPVRPLAKSSGEYSNLPEYNPATGTIEIEVERKKGVAGVVSWLISTWLSLIDVASSPPHEWWEWFLLGLGMGIIGWLGTVHTGFAIISIVISVTIILYEYEKYGSTPSPFGWASLAISIWSTIRNILK